MKSFGPPPLEQGLASFVGSMGDSMMKSRDTAEKRQMAMDMLRMKLGAQADAQKRLLGMKDSTTGFHTALSRYNELQQIRDEWKKQANKAGMGFENMDVPDDVLNEAWARSDPAHASQMQQLEKQLRLVK